MLSNIRKHKKHIILVTILGLFGGLHFSTVGAEEVAEVAGYPDVVPVINFANYENSFSLEPLHDELDAGVVEYISAKQEYDWYQGIIQHEAEVAAAKKAAAAKAAQAKQAKTSAPSSSGGGAQYGSGACGGNLPSCAVMRCESGGNIRAENPRSSASGKWQILSSTWNGYGGYSTAGSAPEHIQDQRAAQIYAGGAGRGAWVC